VGETVEKDTVDLLLDAHERVEAANAELAAAKAERERLESELADEWIARGKQRESRRGRTIYIARDTFASVPADKRAEMRRALEVTGLGDFLTTTVATGKLKAWIKEVAPIDSESGDRDWSQVPPSIRDNINVYERHSMRVTRG